MVELDVLGHLVTLAEREARELRTAAAADAGRSTTRRDLSLLLQRAIATRATVALNRAEARELAELVSETQVSTNSALLEETLLRALDDQTS